MMCVYDVERKCTGVEARAVSNKCRQAKDGVRGGGKAGTGGSTTLKRRRLGERTQEQMEKRERELRDSITDRNCK